jgi:hypothetical protein
VLGGPIQDDALFASIGRDKGQVGGGEQGFFGGMGMLWVPVGGFVEGFEEFTAAAGLE